MLKLEHLNVVIIQLLCLKMKQKHLNYTTYNFMKSLSVDIQRHTLSKKIKLTKLQDILSEILSIILCFK